MRFFFYGTLLDSDVASLVLGRRCRPAPSCRRRCPAMPAAA